MRIAVFGSGAVGGYFGGRLAQAGEMVVFIARGAHLAAIRAQGLRVSSTKGDFTVAPAEAADDPSAIGRVDLVLVGVKAWQVPEAAEALRPLVGPGTMVLPLQNGIEAPGQLIDVLGRAPVLGGYCRLLAHLAGPGHIVHTGGEPHLGYGEMDGSETDRVRTLAAMFAGATGFTATAEPDIRVAMWTKFMFIAATSAIGALTGETFGELRSRPDSRRLLAAALAEASEVARADGVLLPGDSVASTLAFVDSLPEDGTTSMQRDIAAGRPSELEAQAGAVVRLGQRLGVSVPTHRLAYETLLPRERRARGTPALAT
ncbi:MAG TPA: 2-dehydropantoate 2-reductase [Gemmatimonadales bacterium]|nr:2-dehydropantoate 2-reductase [Gemmatimonadales bacterium]